MKLEVSNLGVFISHLRNYIYIYIYVCVICYIYVLCICVMLYIYVHHIDVVWLHCPYEQIKLTKNFNKLFLAKLLNYN